MVGAFFVPAISTAQAAMIIGMNFQSTERGIYRKAVSLVAEARTLGLKP
jgi:hypothetical protein